MDQSDIAAAVTTLGWLEIIKRVGGLMVIAGVAIEVGGDWLSTPFHKKVEDERQLELSKLNNETVRLESDNLKLQHLIAPRRLSAELQSELSSALATFKGRKIRIESYSLDARRGDPGVTNKRRPFRHSCS